MAAMEDYTNNLGGSSRVYVNTELMESALTGIQNQIARIESAIDNYDAKATSLLETSEDVKGPVESNLLGIKNAYGELIPILEKMRTEVKAVEDEYIKRAGSISASQ